MHCLRWPCVEKGVVIFENGHELVQFVVLVEILDIELRNINRLIFRLTVSRYHLQLLLVYQFNPLEPCLDNLTLHGESEVIFYAILEQLLSAFDLPFLISFSCHQKCPHNHTLLPLLCDHTIRGISQTDPGHLFGFGEFSETDQRACQVVVC